VLSRTKDSPREHKGIQGAGGRDALHPDCGDGYTTVCFLMITFFSPLRFFQNSENYTLKSEFYFI
jgi:hypothetical protein